MNRKRGTLTGVGLLCTAAIVITTASAGELSFESTTVSYVAGDLARPEAAAALYQRIRRAAKRVCHETSIREPAEYRAYQVCYERAVDTAVAEVDSSALTALHRSKTRHELG